MPKKLRIFVPEKETVERFEPLATTEKNAKLAPFNRALQSLSSLPSVRFQ